MPRISLSIAAALTLASCTRKVDQPTHDTGGTDQAEVTCLQIDRFDGYTVPPAGIGLGFRVLDCQGNPLTNADGSHRLLQASEISVINGETGEDFNASSEGGAVSEPGTPDNVRVYAMLVLDFSRSIFEAGNEQAVVDGALRFIDATLVNNDTSLNYEVGIIAFGGPDQTEMVSNFTDDPTRLQRALSDAVAAGSRGTTDLYGAYMMGLDKLGREGATAESAGELVERVAVVWSDGAHEAGNADELRQQALDARGSLEGTPFTIYLQGDDTAQEALCELAVNQDACFAVQEASELESVFSTISDRAEAIAQSNYVVGVCTPVALGEPSLTLRVQVDGVQASQEAWYNTDDLSGDVDTCNEEEIKAYYQEYLQGGGGSGVDAGGGDGGSGGAWEMVCDDLRMTCDLPRELDGASGSCTMTRPTTLSLQVDSIELSSGGSPVQLLMDLDPAGPGYFTFAGISDDEDAALFGGECRGEFSDEGGDSGDSYSIRESGTFTWTSR